MLGERGRAKWLNLLPLGPTLKVPCAPIAHRVQAFHMWVFVGHSRSSLEQLSLLEWFQPGLYPAHHLPSRKNSSYVSKAPHGLLEPTQVCYRRERHSVGLVLKLLWSRMDLGPIWEHRKRVSRERRHEAEPKIRT